MEFSKTFAEGYFKQRLAGILAIFMPVREIWKCYRTAANACGQVVGVSSEAASAKVSLVQFGSWKLVNI